MNLTYVHGYHPRENERLQDQAGTLEDLLHAGTAFPAGSQVLDIGCGYGRHAMELAARGFHVVGLDSSLALLLRGADEAQRRGLTINFVHGDMRDMAFDSQFDGAYCLFSTFGYFDDEMNKKTAGNMYDPELCEIFVGRHLGALYRHEYDGLAYEDGYAQGAGGG